MDIAVELLQQFLQFCNKVFEIGVKNTQEEHWYAAAGVLCALIGFQMYISKPDHISFATWFMFVGGDALEASSYFVMTTAEIAMNAVPITFAIGSFVVFVLALKRKQFGMPDWKDTTVMGVDGVITVGWLMGKWSAVGANLMAVSTEVISFIPAGRDILKGKERPYIAPWMWWAVADAFFFLAVISHLKLELVSATPQMGLDDLEKVFYPLVQMIAHFGIVVCIVMRRRYDQRVMAY